MLRASSALFLGSSILFASAFSFVTPATSGTAPKQDAPKKAEEQFKNIQSFKGEPASEIIPAMQLMSASLGVQCGFCHVPQKWDSDDKPEKNAARHMITMTRQINEEHFDGRMQVTCFTCHGGHSHPSSTPVILNTTRRFRADRAMSPETVLSAYRTAIGGDAAVADLKSLHLSGTTKQGDQPAVPVELFEAAPNKFALTIHGEKGNQRSGFNGVDTWMDFGGGANKMDQTHTQLVQRAGRFFRDAASMPALTQKAAGKVTIDGKEFSVVSGELPESHERDLLFFDPSTGLLDRVAYFTTTILGDLPEVYVYSDYQKVGGVLVPFKITHEGFTGSVVMQFTTSEANAKVTDDLFNLPKS